MFQAPRIILLFSLSACIGNSQEDSKNLTTFRPIINATTAGTQKIYTNDKNSKEQRRPKHCNFTTSKGGLNTKASKIEFNEDFKKLLDRITTTEITLICGFSFTFVVGTFGNGFVCFVFGCKTRVKRSITETLLLYLGIVDFLASFFNPLLFSYWTITKYGRWDFGLIGCKILAPLGPITVSISATIIMIICIDRYRAIASPFKGQFTKKQVNTLTCIGIAVSILPYGSYIYYLKVEPGLPCMVRYGGAVGYAVPYVTVILLRDVAYVCVFCFTSFAISKCLKTHCSITVTEDYSIRRNKESRKIVKVLYRIGLVFGILVFPKDLLSVVTTISWLIPPRIASTDTLFHVNGWLKVLNVSNSCVNVFIYSHVHTRFKREVCRLFSIGGCKKFKDSVHKRTLATACDGDTKSLTMNHPKETEKGNIGSYSSGPKFKEMETTKLL